MRTIPALISAAATLGAIGPLGCAGHASVHVASLDARKLTATEPLVVRFHPDECYFWVNERGELCVAMRSKKTSLLGRRFARDFVMSLVLDETPAGPARQYAVGRRVMRARVSAGYAHSRSASLSGVVLLWNYGGDKLRGRFRITAKQQAYSVLTGWKGDQRVLFVGEFMALSNRNAGEKILLHTEEDGMERPAAASKSPASSMAPD